MSDYATYAVALNAIGNNKKWAASLKIVRKAHKQM